MILSAAVTVYCFQKNNPVRYFLNDIFAWGSNLLKKIMRIALPNGIENGVHQTCKKVAPGMVALFGTYQIAANGLAQSIWRLRQLWDLPCRLYIQLLSVSAWERVTLTLPTFTSKNSTKSR